MLVTIRETKMKMNKLQRILGVGMLSVALPIMASGCKYSFDVLTPSPVKQEEAVVVSMNYTPENYQAGTGMLVGAAIGRPCAGTLLGAALSDDEIYYIQLRSKDMEFNLDCEKIYKRFKSNGEKAVVSYREIKRDAYERDGTLWEAFSLCPKFDSKTKLIRGDFKKYEIIDVQPIKEE